MKKNRYESYSKYSIDRKNINKSYSDSENVNSLALNYSYNSSYYVNKNKKQVSITILIFLIIILLAVAVFLIEKKEKKTYFYFLQANEFLNYKDASNLAYELQSKQGAGYIYYDGSYHVIISFYATIVEAESVLENIKNEYTNAKIFNISAQQFMENSRYTNEENEQIKNMILTNENLINQTYNQILSFDKDEISKDILEVNMKNISDEYAKNFENFKKILKNNKNYAIFLKKLTKIDENFKNLYNYAKNGFEDYQLKYELVNIVSCHAMFLSSL